MLDHGVVEFLGRSELEPGSGERVHITPVSALVSAVIPFALAAALIPFRGDLAQSAGIVLVLPVVVIGVSGGAVPGAIAAISAACAFDLFLVEPYLHPSINRSEDVVATLALLLVGIIAGLIGSKLALVDRRAQHRLHELAVLGSHAQLVVQCPGETEIIESTSENLVHLLRLQSCRWEPTEQWDPALTVGQPTMLDNGQIIGRLSDLPADRGRLPNPVEIVVEGPAHPLGRFVIEPGEGHTSIEERQIAMTLCRLSASCLAGSSIQEAG